MNFLNKIINYKKSLTDSSLTKEECLDKFEELVILIDDSSKKEIKESNIYKEELEKLIKLKKVYSVFLEETKEAVKENQIIEEFLKLPNEDSKNLKNIVNLIL